MRQVIAAALLAAVASLTSPSYAASGHWYCTADGIKSWTMNPNMSDASGWTYSGDRSSYSDSGHCTKKM